jgi:hypothetical protein
MDDLTERKELYLSSGNVETKSGFNQFTWIGSSMSRRVEDQHTQWLFGGFVYNDVYFQIGDFVSLNVYADQYQTRVVNTGQIIECFYSHPADEDLLNDRIRYSKIDQACVTIRWVYSKDDIRTMLAPSALQWLEIADDELMLAIDHSSTDLPISSLVSKLSITEDHFRLCLYAEELTGEYERTGPVSQSNLEQNMAHARLPMFFYNESDPPPQPITNHVPATLTRATIREFLVSDPTIQQYLPFYTKVMYPQLLKPLLDVGHANNPSRTKLSQYKAYKLQFRQLDSIRTGTCCICNLKRTLTYQCTELIADVTVPFNDLYCGRSCYAKLSHLYKSLDYIHSLQEKYIQHILMGNVDYTNNDSNFLRQSSTTIDTFIADGIELCNYHP